MFTTLDNIGGYVTSLYTPSQVSKDTDSLYITVDGETPTNTLYLNSSMEYYYVNCDVSEWYNETLFWNDQQEFYIDLYVDDEWSERLTTIRKGSQLDLTFAEVVISEGNYSLSLREISSPPYVNEIRTTCDFIVLNGTEQLLEEPPEIPELPEIPDPEPVPVPIEEPEYTTASNGSINTTWMDGYTNNIDNVTGAVYVPTNNTIQFLLMPVTGLTSAIDQANNTTNQSFTTALGYKGVYTTFANPFFEALHPKFIALVTYNLVCYLILLVFRG